MLPVCLETLLFWYHPYLNRYNIVGLPKGVYFIENWDLNNILFVICQWILNTDFDLLTKSLVLYWVQIVDDCIIYHSCLFSVNPVVVFVPALPFCCFMGSVYKNKDLYTWYLYTLDPPLDPGKRGKGWESRPGTDTCYSFIDTTLLNMFDAEAECNQRGGSLVSINSRDEQDYLQGRKCLNIQLWSICSWMS